MLPVEELEPSFSHLRSVCRELPLGHDETKYLDNLLINADGRICLVECKLWRNPEAVRAVVAQILDYAGELSRLTYEGLNQAELGEPIGRRYMEQVAGFLAPDASIKMLSPGNGYVSYRDKASIPLKTMLHHQDAWLAAIQRAVERFHALDRDNESLTDEQGDRSPPQEVHEAAK